MTRKQAIKQAVRLAKQREAEYFVVYDHEEEDFHVVDEYDMDTFYFGEDAVDSSHDYI